MLKEKFETLCRNFSKNEELIDELWEEIETEHSKKTRHYHTLQHLENIYRELEKVKITALLEFTIFYHDIVYDASRNDNEEESAKLCKQRLLQLNLPMKLIKEITQLINETRTHKTSSQTNALFLDADLAILGSSNYEQYTKNVRQEYSVYDDATYLTGRKKVLKMFLDKKRIYMSKYFYEQYENKARKNLEQELRTLCSL